MRCQSLTGDQVDLDVVVGDFGRWRDWVYYQDRALCGGQASVLRPTDFDDVGVIGLNAAWCKIEDQPIKIDISYEMENAEIDVDGRMDIWEEPFENNSRAE